MYLRTTPRQRTICSLGSLEPGPVEDWLGLAHKLESALQGQESLPKASAEVEPWVEKARRRRDSRARSDEDRSGSTITVAIRIRLGTPTNAFGLA